MGMQILAFIVQRDLNTKKEKNTLRHHFHYYSETFVISLSASEFFSSVFLLLATEQKIDFSFLSTEKKGELRE